ncbi:hypothetical protein NVP1244A_107 [Vibrio phage 1.244.A._10N.261.54.C3]|nr:hypothetical protein NVP1244A_107 [Vibrio phage 1.244.A._10N.261.54.C3]AUR98735.1 hypothetical protein NVP1255O_107 [Vibrio phage 1.255.O._10N.286.45.F1]
MFNNLTLKFPSGAVSVSRETQEAIQTSIAKCGFKVECAVLTRSVENNVNELWAFSSKIGIPSLKLNLGEWCMHPLDQLSKDVDYFILNNSKDIFPDGEMFIINLP